MATITARIPDQKKKEMQLIANELGVSMSNLINMRVHQFVRTKSVSVSIDDTHPAFYDSQESIPVNEDIDTVIDFIQQSLADDTSAHG